MKRLALVLLAGVVGLQVTVAQNSKVTTAANAQYAGDLLKAKQAIDEAVLHEKTGNEANAWQMRGEIHNDIARDTTGQYASVADPLGTALVSLKTALGKPDVKNYRLKIAEQLFITYNLYFTKGAIAYSAGDYEQAFLNFSKANEANMVQIEANPLSALDTGVIFNMALMAEKTNRTTEAIAAFQKLVDMKYSDPYLYSRLPTYYLEANQPDKALAVLDAGRKNFPSNNDIMVAELNYYLGQGKLDELVGKLENAIKLDPNNIELYFVMGSTHGELIKLDSAHASDHVAAAAAAYDKALTIDPKRYDINLNAGALFYNTAIEINKQMNALPYEAQAQYDKLKTDRNKLYNQALPYFERAHQIDPAKTDCMIALKEIYVRLGMDAKAEEMKKKLGQ